MNVIISLLAFILGLKGFFMLLNMERLWIGLRGIIWKNIQLCEPKIEYKLEGQVEMCCRNISATGILERKKKCLVCGAKNFKVGDRVTVWYDLKDANNLFVQPRMQLTRHIFTLFLPGCLYVSLTIWWIYMLLK